jgi:hypothetical protein
MLAAFDLAAALHLPVTVILDMTEAEFYGHLIRQKIRHGDP